MKNENKIDNYFELVKKNPPLIEIEKVHRLIAKVEAKVEVEVKKGHNKLLKFTIMTTIFAVIISAVLLWPTAQEEIPNYKNQKSNAIENTSGSMPLMKQEGNGALTTNKNSDNEIITKTDLNKATTEVTESNLMILDNVQVTPKSITAESPNKAIPIDFDFDTFEPIDGSKFVLKLSKEELEKIGFQVEDSLILYENNWNGMGYRFGKTQKQVFGELTNYTGYYITEEETAFERTEKIQTSDNEFSFYPVYKSSRFYSNVMSNGTLETEFFESANDTLLPIVFPDFEDGDHDILLWFVVNNQLYDLLSANHKPMLDELLKITLYKQKYPQKDFVLYQSPFLLDESKIMKLSEKELEKMGFSFYADSTVYTGKNSRCQIKVALAERNSQIQTMQYDELQLPELNKGPLALFMTDKKGSPLFGSLGLLPILFPGDDEIFKQISLLIPVEVCASGYNESLIFWFLPNENFFNSISEEVSVDLRAEIEYITADDKSTLVKPECKYYEECKNTLQLTDFKIFPNPANYRVSVSFELPETIDARISLVDLAGHERQELHPQSQFAAGKHKLDFDLSNVAEGIYLLALYADKGVQTQRLMVVR